mgnify:CR=1 FL=1
MAKLIKVGDIIKLTSTRPYHWAKNGAMDEFLGKKVEVEYVSSPDKLGIQRITVKNAKSQRGIPWSFLSSDIESYSNPYKIGDEVVLVEPFKVFRLLPNNRLDICDSEGNCISVNRNQVKLKQTDMKAMKDAVLAVAKSLAKANNTVTTLEIKTELRRDYPYYFWTQKVVSDYMDQFAGDGVFTYKDNGTYRIYSLTKTKATAGPVSKSIVSVTTSTGGGIAKVSGTVATKKAPVRKSKNTISRANVLKLVTDPNFESMSITGIGIVTLVTVKSQKKSVQGYLTPSKLSKLTHVKVSGKVYEVK